MRTVSVVALVSCALATSASFARTVEYTLNGAMTSKYGSISAGDQFKITIRVPWKSPSSLSPTTSYILESSKLQFPARGTTVTNIPTQSVPSWLYVQNNVVQGPGLTATHDAFIVDNKYCDWQASPTCASSSLVKIGGISTAYFVSRLVDPSSSAFSNSSLPTTSVALNNLISDKAINIGGSQVGNERSFMIGGVQNSNWTYGTGEISSISVKQLPTNFGLFIGSRDPGSGLQREARFDEMARRLAVAFDSRPDTVAYTLTGDLRLSNGQMQNPITAAQISQQLQAIRQSMLPGDTLTLYIGGHGGSISGATDLNWLEAKLSSLAGYGDEGVRVGQIVYDNWLANELKQFDGFKKMTFVEACHSGGFWGQGDTTEILGSKDLDQLSNIALFASANEAGYSYGNEQGLGFYGLALEDAWKQSKTWTSAELAKYLEDRSEELATLPYYSNPYYFQQDLGDPVLADPSLLKPATYFSSDFNKDELITPVPEPSTYALMLCGLGAVGMRAWRRKRPACEEER